MSRYVALTTRRPTSKSNEYIDTLQLHCWPCYEHGHPHYCSRVLLLVHLSAGPRPSLKLSRHLGYHVQRPDNPHHLTGLSLHTDSMASHCSRCHANGHPAYILFAVVASVSRSPVNPSRRFDDLTTALGPSATESQTCHEPNPFILSLTLSENEQ
jgi:hypothetical protein